MIFFWVFHLVLYEKLSSEKSMIAVDFWVFFFSSFLNDFFLGFRIQWFETVLSAVEKSNNICFFPRYSSLLLSEIKETSSQFDLH